MIVFARPDELRISAQPQENAIQATFIRELWIAGKVVAELNDRQGNLIEISLTPEEARAHQFRPNQTVWLSPLNLHLLQIRLLKKHSDGAISAPSAYRVYRK